MERAAHATMLSALDPMRRRCWWAARPIDESCAASAATTMAGPVSIERTLYRVAGKRNAETVDAVSLRAGWWAMAGCRDGGGDGGVSAGSVARGGSGERKVAAVAILARCAFERVAHLVGNSMEASGREVERAWLRRWRFPTVRTPSVYLLIASGIPMEEPREEGQREVRKGVRKESEKESPKEPKKKKEPERSPKRKAKMRSVQRVFRMAYAATVTLHDATGRPFTPCDMAGCRRGHR